jgi:cysteine desulfurase / selenocysteine lyase
MNSISNLRSQFPILNQKVNRKNLVYLDSAATTQKPESVIRAISNFYQSQNSSSHSVHFLANQLSLEIENTRQIVADFLGSQASEIIFASGSTDSLNLLANGFLMASLSEENSRFKLKATDKILVCIAEHHSNILPWQRLTQVIGCQIEYFAILETGEIDMQDLESKIKDAKVVCFSHVSNVLGLENNVAQICNLAKSIGAICVVDGTQAVSHLNVDVKKLGCDFYCFSGHKVYGPTGIGVLYGKQELLEQLPNYKLGGEMVESVTQSKNFFKESPYRFEAGTSNFAGIIGLKAALVWLRENQKQIFETESLLTKYLQKKLQQIPGLQVLGSKPKDIPLFSCTLENINSFDLATELDFAGIAIRSGQHCAGLLHEFLGLSSSWRVSLGCYNTLEEIDFFVEKINQTIDKYKTE